MSDAPLFQNTDAQEAAYGSPESSSGAEPNAGGDVMAVLAGGLGSGGVGSPAAGPATTSGLPTAFAPLPATEDDVDGATRRTDSSGV